MIQGLTGVPGGGKSYYAVYKMLKLLEAGQIVVHNVHGFNDSRAISWEFGQMPLDADSLFKEFDMIRLSKGVPPETMIYVFIDEAQRFWPYEYKDPRGVFFFDFHRHHGLEITLISQDIKKISPKISTLFEQEIRAVKPMFQLQPGFQYNLLSSGELFGKERLPKKQEVFAAYTSFLAGSGAAKKSRYVYIIPAAVIFAIIMFFVLQYSLKNSFTRLAPSVSEAETSLKKISSEPVSVGAPAPAPGDTILGGGASTNNKSDSDLPHVSYLGPEIVSNRGPYVSIKVDDDSFEEEMLIADFVEKYPPTVYGYSYFSAPSKSRFVLMDRYSSDILYPVKNAVARSSFITSSPSPSSSPAASPVTADDVLAAMPKTSPGWGYSTEDERLMNYFSEVSKGLNPSKFYSSGQTPQTFESSGIVSPE
jgi:hypothetical protein